MSFKAQPSSILPKNVTELQLKFACVSSEVAQMYIDNSLNTGVLLNFSKNYSHKNNSYLIDMPLFGNHVTE